MSNPYKNLRIFQNLLKISLKFGAHPAGSLGIGCIHFIVMTAWGRVPQVSFLVIGVGVWISPNVRSLPRTSLVSAA